MAPPRHCTLPETVVHDASPSEVAVDVPVIELVTEYDVVGNTLTIAEVLIAVLAPCTLVISSAASASDVPSMALSIRTVDRQLRVSKRDFESRDRV